MQPLGAAKALVSTTGGNPQINRVSMFCFLLFFGGGGGEGGERECSEGTNLQPNDITSFFQLLRQEFALLLLCIFHPDIHLVAFCFGLSQG